MRGTFDTFHDEIGDVLVSASATDDERQAAQVAMMEKHGETFRWERILSTFTNTASIPNTPASAPPSWFFGRPDRGAKLVCRVKDTSANF